VESFLKNRKQQVTVDGKVSTEVAVTSGVPQGSVLGPLLFIIFINDICDDISSQIRLFADDVVLYREIRSEEDRVILQSDLDVIVAWCQVNNMELNYSKCLVLHVTGRRQPPHHGYVINECDLEKVNSLKYLGIYISSDLKWTEQVQYSVNKANRALGFVRRNLTKCSKEVRLKAYKSLVRPHLEYGCCAWDPYQANAVDFIEKVQRRAVRYICSAYNVEDSVSDLISGLKLSTLAVRRQNHRLSLMYKLDRDLCPLQKPLKFQRKPVQRRNDNGYSYTHYNGRADYYMNSFFPWTVRQWNSLTSEIAASTTLPIFKSAITHTI
jgi:ribonucleases P/MRP protein subunit RPP40